MNTVALSGKDVAILDNRLLTDLADGDAVSITYSGDIMNVKKGKDGNTIYSANESGTVVDFEIRVIRGSADDKFLNNKLTQQRANPAGFILMAGEFIKKIGNGLGKITNDTYILSGGVFTRMVDGKTNSEGDTEQSVSIYKGQFSNAPRAIG